MPWIDDDDTPRHGPEAEDEPELLVEGVRAVVGEAGATQLPY